MKDYLVESALLTHGLKSVTNEELLNSWPDFGENIVWLDKGRITIGSMQEFLPFREKSDKLVRINCESIDSACSEKISGAFTASGTIAVCRKLGISTAISCGIGGIGDIRGEELCPDLPVLCRIPVKLLCTSFKDMLDIQRSIDWLRDRGVRVCGVGTDRCTGYIFDSANAELDGSIEAGDIDSLSIDRGSILIFNPIPGEKRIKIPGLLEKGIAEGKEAEDQGRYYHPAVNACFDRETGGYSSRIQLEALINNVRLVADK